MNSSSLACQWRCDDQVPGLSVVRFTPNWLRPTTLPRRFRSRPTTGFQNGSGYMLMVSTGTLAPSILGIASDPFNDRRRSHANADAKRHQRGLKIAPFELVEHGTENHRTGCAERMAHRDRAAIDVDLVV